jgi:hypothetical protein
VCQAASHNTCLLFAHEFELLATSIALAHVPANAGGTDLQLVCISMTKYVYVTYASCVPNMKPQRATWVYAGSDLRIRTANLMYMWQRKCGELT